jgi:hypothetical protein
MRGMRKFGAAALVAAMMASGMTIFSTPVYASTGTSATSFICKLLASAEAAVNTLPNSPLKTYLLKEIDEAQLRYRC